MVVRKAQTRAIGEIRTKGNSGKDLSEDLPTYRDVGWLDSYAGPPEERPTGEEEYEEGPDPRGRDANAIVDVRGVQGSVPRAQGAGN